MQQFIGSVELKPGKVTYSSISDSQRAFPGLKLPASLPSDA